VDISLEQAVGTYNLVGLNHYLLKTARGLDISMGD